MSHRWHDPGHHPIQARADDQMATEPTPPRHRDPDTGTTGMLHGSGHAYDICAAVFFGGRRRRVFTRLAAESGARPGDRVLDVGCGTGYFTRVLAQAVAPAGAAHGVDPSREAISHARRLSHLDNSTFGEGVAEALDAPDAAYDVVVSSLMIHHLPETVRPRAISEMFRVLQPGGSVLIAEFRPPASRIGRRVITRVTGHDAMAENRVDLLEPMIRDAGFDQARSGEVRPWIYYVQAQKPARRDSVWRRRRSAVWPTSNRLSGAAARRMLSMWEE
jgi:ubiquinone/menaquinone biosynthesis C-methylase UbiE